MEAVVTSTPAAAPAPTSTASPATVDTSSASASGKRPTFAEAFATDAAPPSSDVSTSTEPAATAPVETSPAASAPPTSSAETKGPIPFEVHKTTLENARAKEREAVSAEWKPYEAIRNVTPDQMHAWFATAHEMASDPVSFAIKFIDGLQNDARYAPQLRSHAGRLLAAGRNPDPEPQPDREIVDAAGNVIGQQFADGGKAYAAWYARQEAAKVRQEFAPLKADHESRQHADARAQETAQQIEASAEAQIAEIRELVESDDLLPEVHKAMAEHPDWSPRKCALFVRDDKVVSPKLSAKAQSQALDDLKTKAAASTVNPAAAAVASTKRPTSFHDPSLKW